MLVALVPAAAVRTLVRSAIGFDAEILAIAEETADLVDACRPSLAGRSRRVAELARDLAHSCDFTEEDSRRAYLAAHLHDITAALAPEHASLEAETFDDEQREYRRAHADEGARWVRDVLRLHGVAEAMRFHHERFDGRGYPVGLAGADIPLDSRIVAVCEAWVSLTSDRGYRPAFTEQQALLVMHAGAGTQWDPDVVHALRDLVQGATATVRAEVPVPQATPAPRAMAA
jgi:HD-GYP domain-containing protein (c-di-GMP phosphodiesterase class II)